MATTDWVAASDDLVPGTRARAEEVNQKFDNIGDGFALLPTPQEVYADKANWGVDSGTANAFVVTKDYPLTALVAGSSVKFIVGTSNTDACTLNVDGLGVKNLVKQNNTPMVAGDVPAGMVLSAVYDGTRFRADSLTTLAVNPAIIDDDQESSVLTWSSEKIVSEFDDLDAALAAGQLDGRYYTETELDAGQLDNRYYTETEVDVTLGDYYTSSQLDAGQLDGRYYTETELLTGGALDGRYFTETELTSGGALDGRYYTETEVDALLGDYYTSAQLNAGQLDSRYYTESEVDALLGGYLAASDIGTSIQGYDADTPTELATVTELEAGAVSDPRSIRPDRAKSILVGSAGKVRLTADGDVAAGAPVKINSDGTMSELSTAYAAGSVGTAETLTETMAHNVCCYDAGENVVIFSYYAGTSIKAVAATVSGATLSFGTAITLTGTPLVNGQLTIASLGTGLAAVCFADSAQDIRISLLSVSGTTLAEEDQGIQAGSFNHLSMAYDLSASIGLLAATGSSSSSVTAYAFTNTSTTITIEASDFSSGGAGPSSGGVSVVFDTVNSKFVVTLVEDDGSDEALIFINCPVTGVTPDLKNRTSSVDLNLVINGSATLNGAATVFDPDRAQVVALGQKSGGDVLIRFNASTLHGSILSVDEDVLQAEGFYFSTRPGIAYDETLNKIILVGPDAFSSDIAVAVALNNTGSAMEYEGVLTYQASATNSAGCSICYDSDNGQCIAGASDVANDDLTAYAITPLTETSESDKYFGLADEAVSDAASGVVTFPGGVNGQQSGLQVGDTYWIDADGTLTNADSGYRRVGTALSSTTIACG